MIRNYTINSHENERKVIQFIGCVQTFGCYCIFILKPPCVSTASSLDWLNPIQVAAVTKFHSRRHTRTKDRSESSSCCVVVVVVAVPPACAPPLCWGAAEEQIFRLGRSFCLLFVFLSPLPLCLLSGVPAKWMLCLPHVLAPSSRRTRLCVCVRVRAGVHESVWLVFCYLGSSFFAGGRGCDGGGGVCFVCVRAACQFGGPAGLLELCL